MFSKLYSKSFDKYKIVENILLKKGKKLSKSKSNYSELSQMNMLKEIKNVDTTLENDEEKENKEQNLIYNKIDSESDEYSDVDNNIYSINKEKKQERILPKRNFIEFIYNTFYNENNCY